MAPARVTAVTVAATVALLATTVHAFSVSTTAPARRRRMNALSAKRSAKEFSAVRSGKPRKQGSKDGGKQVSDEVVFTKFVDVPVAEQAAQKVLELCSEEERDVEGIMALCVEASDAAREAGYAPAGFLQGDWGLVYASSDDALSSIGTGLQKVALTRMEEMFISFGPFGNKQAIETAEILRVIGPFPNVRNTLAGKFSVKEDLIAFEYSSMTDGLGRAIKAKDGGDTRKCKGRVGYVNAQVLMYFPDMDGSEGQSGSQELLIFRREPDLEARFAELRVDVDRDENGEEVKDPSEKKFMGLF